MIAGGSRCRCAEFISGLTDVRYFLWVFFLNSFALSCHCCHWVSAIIICLFKLFHTLSANAGYFKLIYSVRIDSICLYSVKSQIQTPHQTEVHLNGVLLGRMKVSLSILNKCISAKLLIFNNLLQMFDVLRAISNLRPNSRHTRSSLAGVTFWIVAGIRNFNSRMFSGKSSMYRHDVLDECPQEEITRHEISRWSWRTTLERKIFRSLRPVHRRGRTLFNGNAMEPKLQPVGHRRCCNPH